MNSKITLLFLISLYSCTILSQDWSKWQPSPNFERKMFKMEDSTLYLVDSSFDEIQRDRIATKVKECMINNLNLLQEKPISPVMGILALPDYAEIYRLFGKKEAAITDDMNGQYMVAYIENTEHCALNRELMGVAITKRWGTQTDSQSAWIKEGLKNYASPEVYSCDSYTIEERYIYLLKNDKLIDIRQFPDRSNTIQYKIACNQSAYIVKCLSDQYGMDKLKQLWKEGMTDFEKIYGFTFDDFIVKVNSELNKKHPNSIDLDWKRFAQECNPFPESDWLPAYNSLQMSNPQLNRMVTKEIGNLRFTVDSTLTIAERNEIRRETNEYIDDCLKIINEKPFNDSIHIYLVPTQNDMKLLLGGRIGGISGLKNSGHLTENTIYSVHGKKHSPLKHEVMHIVSFLKWGRTMSINTTWLEEALAVYACPESLDCDGHTFEERYVYFLQNDKLLSTSSLFDQEMGEESFQYKIFYSQSAFIVGYLIENYGVDKLKKLWQSSDIDFNEIYGITFDGMIQKINSELNKKYPEPIDFNWEGFKQTCIE